MPRPSEQELRQFYFRLDQIPELRGAGVAYLGDGECTVLRSSHHSSGLQTFVIIQEKESAAPPTPSTVSPPDIRTELMGLGLNCGGAVLSLFALVGEGAAVPISGGSSAFLTGVTWLAFTATALQCIISAKRTDHLVRGDAEWVLEVDSDPRFVRLSIALDLVSLAGAAAAGAQTVRAVKALQRATGRELPDILKGLNRAERKRLTQELIRMQRPGISNSAMKDLIRAGTFPSRFEAAQITQAIYAQLRDAICAMMTFVSSALSGAVSLLYIHVFQE